MKARISIYIVPHFSVCPKNRRLQSPQGFCMNGEYKVFYKIRNKLSEMLEKDLSSVTFFCFEQRHEGRWKLVILESSEEDEMEEKRWSPKWSQEKVTRFLYKVGSITTNFLSSPLLLHRCSTQLLHKYRQAYLKDSLPYVVFRGKI